MSAWNKRQRLEAVVRGEPADRVPVALWRHFPGDDQDPQTLAAAHAAFQREFDFDFLKVSPASSFSVEDWGAEHYYDGNPEGARRYGRRAVQEPADWYRLEELDVTQGALSRQLQCLRRLAEALPDTPLVQTIFNPLSQARYLAGDERILIHMRTHPQALLAGLETITHTTARFVEEVIAAGATGIFLAVQSASYRIMSEEEYRRFGRPFDLLVLEALGRRAWFSVLHIHGKDIMFDLLADYPVQAVNWHDQETPPSLSEALTRTRAALIGGLRQWETMVCGTPADVQREAADAIARTGGRRLILGTGCVTPVVAPLINIRAARQAVENSGQ